MNISSNDFKNGISIVVDGEIYTIVEFQHSKTARGSAFVRTKLKNLKSGLILEKTFRAGEKVPRAYIETKKMQYLYRSDEDLVMMDQETYEQLNLPSEMFGEGIKWIKEGDEVSVLFYEDQPVALEIPKFVELEVKHTEPGFKGDTATGGSKPATLETGAVVNVPLFVEIGDKIQVDTRSGEYLKRL